MLLLLLIMILVVFIIMLLMVLLLLSLLLLMLLLFVADVVPAVVVVIVFLLQLYSDKGIPLGEKIVHVRPPTPTPLHPPLPFFFYNTLPHGQPQAVSGGFISILEGGCC